ncbi:MAG TPA: c-type cytochrome [Anaerolineales bacterium]|nr:c-type cytochrome [Anaerolineales bacterium]
MRRNENYTPHITVAFGLTLAILVSFQIYIWQEPSRITEDLERDQLLAVTAGRSLYAENCSLCHGEDGEGADGPALNDKSFLVNTSDETIFSLIGSGVPSSEMPAWNQAFGGPFTDQQIQQIVAFMRNWEGEAPDRRSIAMQGDPVNGLTIFSSTCVICHGEDGLGSERAPAINDPAKLEQFDDDWYEQTIAEGRPAQGMPTWGTVLSPEQIRDLVALLRAWERGETVDLPGIEVYLHEASHAIGHNDLEEAEHQLEEATKIASGDQLQALEEALNALRSGDISAAQEAIERAETMSGSGMMMPEMDMGKIPVQPGEKEARAALEDLESGNLESATARLRVAQVLAQGDLKEAIEHSLEDVNAGRVQEAIEVLREVLGNVP